MTISHVHYAVASFLVASLFAFVAIWMKRYEGGLFGISIYYLLRMLIGGIHLIIFNYSGLFSLHLLPSVAVDGFSLVMVCYYAFLPHPRGIEAGQQTVNN